MMVEMMVNLIVLVWWRYLKYVSIHDDCFLWDWHFEYITPTHQHVHFTSGAGVSHYKPTKTFSDIPLTDACASKQGYSTRLHATLPHLSPTWHTEENESHIGFTIVLCNHTEIAYTPEKVMCKQFERMMENGTLECQTYKVRLLWIRLPVGIMKFGWPKLGYVWPE